MVADCYTLAQIAVCSDLHIPAHYDSTEVADVQTRSELRFAVDTDSADSFDPEAREECDHPERYPRESGECWDCVAEAILKDRPKALVREEGHGDGTAAPLCILVWHCGIADPQEVGPHGPRLYIGRATLGPCRD